MKEYAHCLYLIICIILGKKKKKKIQNKSIFYVDESRDCLGLKLMNY